MKEFYQDANVGPTVDLIFSSWVNRLPIKPNICHDESEGWRMTPNKNQVAIRFNTRHACSMKIIWWYYTDEYYDG